MMRPGDAERKEKEEKTARKQESREQNSRMCKGYIFNLGLTAYSYTIKTPLASLYVAVFLCLAMSEYA
jgi:hypothetical protein